MTIAVTGAGGQLGRLVVEKLKARNGPPTSSRLPAAERPAGLAVPVSVADYTRPDTLDTRSWARAAPPRLVQRDRPARPAAPQCAHGGEGRRSQRIAYTSLLHADTTTLNLAPSTSRRRGAQEPRRGVHDPAQRLVYREQYGRRPIRAGARRALGGAGNGRFSSAAARRLRRRGRRRAARPERTRAKFRTRRRHAYTLSDLAAEIARNAAAAIAYMNLRKPNTRRAESPGLPAASPPC